MRVFIHFYGKLKKHDHGGVSILACIYHLQSNQTTFPKLHTADLSMPHGVPSRYKSHGKVKSSPNQLSGI